MQKKLHNPKSHSPAVYIPCWLIQVSTKLISNNAKILYGRLCQWCNSTGDVYRSLPQLSQELGTPVKTLERHLKELKDTGLIGTYHPQAGGMNHYEFYHHPWMDEPICEQLIYKSDPPSEMRVPTLKNEGTPPSEMRDINIKEIKRNNLNINTREEKNSDWENHKATYELARKDEAKQIALSISDSEKSFAEFWNLYPVKKSEGRAKAAWLSQNCHQIFPEILTKLAEQLKKDCWYQELKYIPNPAKYLMEEKWKDDIVEDKKKKTSGYTLSEVMGA